MAAADGPRTPTTEATYASLLSDPRLVVVLWLSFAGTMGVNVASPALPAMADTLGVTDARIGLVMTAYTLPAMVFVPFTGALADVYGRRTVVIPSLVAFAVGGTLVAFAASLGGPAGPLPLTPFQVVLALRAVQGAGVAGFMALSVTLLGDLYAGAAGASAQGLRVGGNGVSSTVLPVLAGALSGLAWSVPFLLYAAVGAIAVAAFVWLPETAAGVGNGNGDGDGDGDGVGIRETFAQYGTALRAELTDLEMGVLVSGGFARDFTRYAVLTFVPLFAVRVLGASFAVAGGVLALRGMAYIGVSPFAGWVSSRLSHRGTLLLALVLSGASAAAMSASSSVVVLAGLVALYTVGDSLFSPVIKDAVTGAASDEYRSGVVGGMQLLKYGGQTASPVVFGAVLAVSGFDALFWLAGAVLGVYALAVIVLLDRSVGTPSR